MNTKVLIVEDDNEIANLIFKFLKNWGFEPYLIKNFEDVTSEFVNINPNIVLMDITLPFFNGYYWTRDIRKLSEVPIIFLSSASENLNVIMAIEMGADDFIAKPFDMEVLVAKIKALLRRSYDYSINLDILEYKGLILNLKNFSISNGEISLELTKNEFRILELLLMRKGELVSRSEIMEYLWKTDNFIDDNTLSVNVSRLRKTLKSMGYDEFIKTKVGVGYYV